MSVLTSYRHQIQAGDIAIILDSLQELFRERGDAVTPKQLAERMENKMPGTFIIHMQPIYARC